MAVEPAIEVTVLPVLIGTVNVRAMVEQPEQAFSIMRKVSASHVSR
jgi:hypothetical protein